MELWFGLGDIKVISYFMQISLVIMMIKNLKAATYSSLKVEHSHSQVKKQLCPSRHMMEA